MADYVVDASVIIERLSRGPYTAAAQVLFHGLAQDDRLIIPEFCLLEYTNVLWKQVRFQGLPRTQALSLLYDLRSLPLQRRQRPRGQVIRHQPPRHHCAAPKVPNTL